MIERSIVGDAAGVVTTGRYRLVIGIDHIDESGVTNLVWTVDPGEAPRGIQTIATDGSLLDTETLVGLPGR